ncbi:alpha-2-macroglobulin receptor-associated protein [Hyalella azteca]|uniref:Alpha-2-macroglobulin receptor-associated protein n=1 Tax=Hyalella azteca TaxID=294128 RepID=A0A8B7P636_HYAAZ|nr:alpha-2-macroglobulin receptor-associated protein [Hyalella azteca]XP_018020556.1 alpha-2-macroglobulin receptor-associated protein [Hyalella azteca]
MLLNFSKMIPPLLYQLAILLLCLSQCVVLQEFNEKNIREAKKPFRMAKINLVWEKALKQLSDQKLVILMSELKIQDKQELTFKKHKAEGGDKDGQMEARLRKSLQEIMSKYKLGQPQGDDETVAFIDSNKQSLDVLFKDKKLNKLWAKAEQSGFTQEELKVLKDEFQHHQDKIDQYYDLLQTHKDSSSKNNELPTLDDLDSLESNEIPTPEGSSINEIRGKNRGLKDSYHNLHKLVARGAESKEFIEPKVAGLWRLAAAADFTQEELESLHTELRHYENRLLKVRHLTGQVLKLHKPAADDEEHPDHDIRLEQKLLQVSESEGERLLQERLAKQRRTVEKLHEDLETRILQRHSEL